MKKPNRIQLEKNYWNSKANDPDVDNKYICNLSDELCLKELGLLSGKVLDLGCGVGRLMKQDYFGIDISEKMIMLAKSRKPQCRFFVNDGRTIPFDDDYFNYVYCVLVFQHIPSIAVANYIIEVARVLKDKGDFIFQFIEGDEDESFSHHHFLKDLEKILEANGLSIVKVRKKKVHDSWTWVRARKGYSKPLKKSTSSKKKEK